MNNTLIEFAILCTAIANFAAGYFLHFFRTRKKLKKHNEIFEENILKMQALTQLNQRLLQEQQAERLYAAGWKNEALVLRKDNDRMKGLLHSMQQELQRLQGNKKL